MIFKIVGSSGWGGRFEKGVMERAKIFPPALRSSCNVSENHHCSGGSRVLVTFSLAQSDLFTCLKDHTVTSL